MIDCGVPAGASSAIHEPDSPPGTPASAMVGTSGSAGFRFACVTARPFSFPDLMWPEPSSTEANSRSTWPAIRSIIAGPPPLYGTCVIFVPVSSWNSSAVRCGEPPLPELA